MIFEALMPLAIWALALSLVLYGSWLCKKHFESRPPRLDAPFGLYPVSVLKPLKGADHDLRKNLETFFKLDYPEYELIFSVANYSDPARSVVEELIERYPKIDARLIVGQVLVGPNPKVNNLVLSYEHAKYDLLLISDSNTVVKNDFLKRLVAHLENGVGIITAVVAGRAPKGLGANLEAVYLNTFYARGMQLAAAFGNPCVVGKVMLFRRSTSDRFGGIKALGKYLAEDYMAGEAMQHLGLRVALMTDPIIQPLGEFGFSTFWSRHIRWGRIRKAQAPLAFLLEPLSNSILSGLIGAMAAANAFGMPGTGFFALHMCVWFLCDLMVMRRMNPGVEATTLFIWLLRELLAFPLWVHVASGNTVEWRGKRLRLLAGGALEQ
ncbi:MAG: ceramide glucosyltransferase [Bdellovibrionota bacterium]